MIKKNRAQFSNAHLIFEKNSAILLFVIFFKVKPQPALELANTQFKKKSVKL